jgi:hypothetical protein
MTCHHKCSQESLFADYPDHTCCRQVEGDEGGTILSYTWNRELQCLVNQPADAAPCNLVVIYDYAVRPGTVHHFVTVDEAVAYLKIFFDNKSSLCKNGQ